MYIKIERHKAGTYRMYDVILILTHDNHKMPWEVKMELTTKEYDQLYRAMQHRSLD